MQRRIAKIFLLLSALCFLSCGTIQVYRAPAGPVFYSNAINAGTLELADSLKVVSFNIRLLAKVKNL